MTRRRRGKKELNDEEEKDEAIRRKTRRRSKVEGRLPARPEQCYQSQALQVPLLPILSSLVVSVGGQRLVEESFSSNPH